MDVTTPEQAKIAEQAGAFAEMAAHWRALGAETFETRLGPYELHDFFLFHYLVDGASADKLRELARIAFAGEHSREEVDGTLVKFIRRFHAAQYKRNCVPDGPKITLSLSPRADWRMPSDMCINKL